MRAEEITQSSIPLHNMDQVYSLLYKFIDSGPFDGGCVIFAQALQLLYGGEIYVLIGKAQRIVKNNSALHAFLKLGNTAIDADGPTDIGKLIERFQENELQHAGGYVTSIRPIEAFDLPDAPRNTQLAKKIATLLK